VPRGLQINCNLDFGLDGGYASSTSMEGPVKQLTSSVLLLVLVLLTACASSPQLVDATHAGRPTGVPSPTTTNEVRVARTAGGLRLPLLSRAITDPPAISHLAADVRSLPVLPPGEHCPADLGTVYTLTFVQPMATWTAAVHAQGCETVQLSTGATLWAIRAPVLWDDLAAALRISRSQVNPVVCGGATPSVVAGAPCVPPA
jgi:hypothetical protein